MSRKMLREWWKKQAVIATTTPRCSAERGALVLATWRQISQITRLRAEIVLLKDTSRNSTLGSLDETMLRQSNTDKRYCNLVSSFRLHHHHPVQSLLTIAILSCRTNFSVRFAHLCEEICWCTIIFCMLNGCDIIAEFNIQRKIIGGLLHLVKTNLTTHCQRQLFIFFGQCFSYYLWNWQHDVLVSLPLGFTLYSVTLCINMDIILQLMSATSGKERTSCKEGKSWHFDCNAKPYLNDLYKAACDVSNWFCSIFCS